MTKKSLFFALAVVLVCNVSAAQEFNKVPSSWKWLDGRNVIFSYDGTYTDSNAFSYDAGNGLVRTGVKAPERYEDFPVKPEGAVNLTYSPDSTKIAFTRANDLYVVDLVTGRETRLTDDGTELILNGYASWVYYEEIFGRASRYRAFWWSPDSRKIAFYRFDNTNVPLFPIYSPFGQDGSLSRTRYPKAGERNPEVRIAMVDLGSGCEKVWADFDASADCYYGTPFWGPDNESFYVSRMPRTQNTLELFRVSSSDGSMERVYEEHYPTWLEWIDKVIFTDKGLYMARAFETGWQQIYFLSYDGKTFRRLTDGENWNISLVRVDEKAGKVYFVAARDETVRSVLYCVDSKGLVTALTDPEYSVRDVTFSPDGKYFVASYSNGRTPVKVAVFESSRPKAVRSNDSRLAAARLGKVVADMAGPDFNPENHALPQLVKMTTEDGFVLPGLITFPKSLERETGHKACELAADAMNPFISQECFEGLLKRYPVVFEVYGGPDTETVRDSWRNPSPSSQWMPDNDIVTISVDPRSAGHNGRAGEDLSYRQLSVHEVQDYVAWAEWVTRLPYINPEKTGVEGFSFGGTTTVMLLCRASEHFHYGIAGGGVYDWNLYDTHYTERFMDTPQNNPEGYRISTVLNYVDGYPVTYDNYDGKVMLKLTHGTGDDNVHFQNTLQLIDRMHRKNMRFELMIYPDGMHGYRGYQGEHDKSSDHEFWLRYLCDK